ncbi:MAG: hypothetical protein ACYCZF_01765 [Anaerolineae bacterium]
MLEWFTVHPWVTGVVTLLLMWIDWLLTILQERERRLHYSEHYQSYPVNTIEGNPLFQKAVNAMRVFEPRHLILALILSSLSAYALVWIPQQLRVAFIGYVWGLYLIVITTHISNLIGYRASRRGLHGMLYLHLRTGYLVQMGRYLALAGFLIVLALCSASSFMVGTALAGVTSAARQVLWLRRIPAIGADDAPPAGP